MKYLLCIGFLLITTSQNFGQSNRVLWLSNVKEVKDLAQKEDRKILMVFAGSDWCRPCIKFKKDILDDDLFKEYADENIIILYLDFPSKKENKLSKEQTKHHEVLADRFNSSGVFPKILLMDYELDIIKEIKVADQTVNEFIKQLKS